MTCVWDGLISILHKNNLLQNIKPLHFVTILKTLNKKCNVKVNGIKVNKKQQIENMERIKCINDLQNGYLFSGFDPVLILICELYKVNISHNYCNHVIKYEYCGVSCKTLNVYSNSGHFWS